MNNTVNTANTLQSPVSAVDHNAPAREYRPRLSFYHANSKGTGSVAAFEVVPATGLRDGAVFMTMAAQKSVASGSREEGTRKHATFDWQNRLVVKLNFNDLCQMLQVLQGHKVSIAEGKGLYHESRSGTTVINLALLAEPYPGHSLEVSRREKGGGESAARIRIFFNSAEAYGLASVLEQALMLVAFGIPRVNGRAPTVNESESMESFEPLPF